MALIHSWPLQDVSGTTVCEDTVDAADSVYANSSRTVTTGPGGLYPLAQDFNNSTDYITIAPSTAISFAAGTAYSFSFWVKLSETAAAEPFVGQTGASQGRVEATADTNIVQHTSVNFAVSPAMGTTNWHHILATRTAGNLASVFVDGVSQGTPTNLGVIFAPIVIGRRQGLYFGGLMAGVKVYNTDESANVAALINEAKPQNTVAPSITGTLELTETLTAVDGTWSDGTTTARQWRMAQDASGGSTANISGETGTTYAIDDADLDTGDYVGVQITRTNSIGSTTTSSSWYGPITAAGGDPPENLTLPTITGVLVIGETLTAVDGTWDSGSTSARQWRVANSAGGAGAADISGETGATYVIDVDEGQYVSVRVTRTNANGDTDADSGWNGPITSASTSQSRRKRN